MMNALRAAIPFLLIVAKWETHAFSVKPAFPSTRRGETTRPPVALNDVPVFLNGITLSVNDVVSTSVDAQIDPTVLGAAALAAVAAAALGMQQKGDKVDTSSEVAEPEPEPEPEPIDVSIPYDAAARLAYDEWRHANEKGEFDAAGYEAFKAIYETKVVAEVVVKKMERELSKL